MKENGAIICFQKYSTEYRKNKADDIDGPVCLGYFNRVEVRGIQTFRKYVHHASKYQADRACSRKQLLLRKRAGMHEEIEIRDERSRAEGRLPFCSSDHSEEFYLGCCSVFNVRDGGCRKNAVKEDRCATRENLARELYEQIREIQHDGNFRFAVMESLGTEDLCLIVLTNHYDHISNVIKVVQAFSCKKRFGRGACGSKCIIDNGHSILMIDRDRLLKEDMWGATQASIHFSLRSAAGLHYLREVERKLNASGILRDGECVKLDGCSGEYDALMQCPARLVMDNLFGSGGFFAQENEVYQRSVYQSETFVYPIGMTDTPHGPDALLMREDSQLKTELNNVVEKAIADLRVLFQYTEDDPDFDYIELPIWRLLKDYWSFASFPLNKDLREDLKIQLIASVNAIVKEAEKCIDTRKIDHFQESYDQIVDALRASMQAGSQQDRWNFGEQKSYIQNVDSYYKILRCYYGVIKDLIALIYHIERSNGQDQPLLIPLLSFGVKSIIKSDCFDSTIDGRPARLICIRLPYQALANLPRYLGPLAHELFHYSAPAQRTVRNELMIKALIRLALTEFVSILANALKKTDDENYWETFFVDDDGLQDVFDLDAAVKQIYSDIAQYYEDNEKEIASIKLDEIKRILMPECLYFSKFRADRKPFQFYYGVWKNLRRIVKQYLEDLDEEKLDEERYAFWREMFALDKLQKHASESDGKQGVKSDDDSRREESRTLWDYHTVVEKISTEAIANFHKLLYNMFKAMEECPADIFNLEVVMAEKDAQQKVRQYLWQINGAKRDATLVRAYDQDNVDLWPFQDRPNGLLCNQIRNAMIIFYYLKSKEIESLCGALESWTPESGRYKASIERVKDGFIQDYEYSMVRFPGLFGENSEICDAIATRIRRLMGNDECRGIMSRLRDMYERYYRLLEQRQRSEEEAGEKAYQDKLFELCCDLIDAYQSQSALDVISVTSALMASCR